MGEPQDNRGQVPARIDRSEPQSPWINSEISRTVTTPMNREQAAQLVSRLLGGYPSLSLHDPESYIAGVTALLCGFSWWVGERAIEKVSTESKFVPSKAEVATACNHFAPSKATGNWAADWDARSRKQLEERDRSSSAQAPKQTLEELRTEMRGCGFPMGGPLPHKETPETVREKLNLTQAQWDAIPDADPGHWDQLMAKHRAAPAEGGA